MTASRPAPHPTELACSRAILIRADPVAASGSAALRLACRVRPPDSQGALGPGRCSRCVLLVNEWLTAIPPPGRGGLARRRSAAKRAAREDVMIFDHRTYTVRPGTLPKQLELYEKHGKAPQERHLGKPLL